VLRGGTSEEREVSLRSGKAVYTALQEAGYNVHDLDFTKENINKIIDIAPDVVFIALHGKNGEDGTVQGFLDLLGIPYTGSGVAASAIGMNKILTKKFLSYEGMPTSDFVILDKEIFNNGSKNTEWLLSTIGLPMVVKASTQGSSIGVFIVRKEEDILGALKKAFEFDSEILVEKFIDGIELTAAVVGNNEPHVLPIIEITSENEFYDYESKYTKGMCAHIIPARINDNIRQRVMQIASQVYKSIGCRGYARIDFIVDKEDRPYVLEINTIPGMTEMSLVPDAARADGISFVELVDRILKLAIEG
jgi:D-alanine-D-alanine ligase